MSRFTLNFICIVILTTITSCSNSNKNKIILENNFDSIYGWFEGCSVSNKNQHSGNYSFYHDQALEYGMGYMASVGQTIPKGINSITIEAWVLSKQAETDLSIVFEISQPDKTVVLWQSCNSKAVVTQANKWTQITSTFSLPKNLPDDFIVKSYSWNRNKGEYFVDDIKIYGE